MSVQPIEPESKNAPRDRTIPQDLGESGLDNTPDIEDLAREGEGRRETISDRNERSDFVDIEPGDLGAGTTASGIGEDDTGAGIGDTRLGAQDEGSGFGEPRGQAERTAQGETVRGK